MPARWKRHLARAVLVFAVIGWPLTALTIAKGEPQFILGLSWLAIILATVDGLWVAEMEVKEEDEDNTEGR